MLTLSELVLQRIPEAGRIPWWLRVAYWKLDNHEAVVLPIGIHWVVRQARNLWFWTFRYQGSRWEGELLAAEGNGRRAGYKAGYDAARARLRTCLHLRAECESSALDMLLPPFPPPLFPEKPDAATTRP